MKIAIGGIMHESNSFSAKPTTLESFEEASLTEGDELRNVWSQAHHEVGGYLEGGERFGFQAVPALMAWATPSGAVQEDAFDTLTDRLIEHLNGGKGFDGMLLALHGAMVKEGLTDGDGEILRRIRRAVGRDFPIVCTLDFHANVSEEMVELADALVIYKTNPHVDQRGRGIQAADLITRIVKGEVRPVQALAKPRMIFPILHQNTARGPLRPVLDEAADLEERAPYLAVNLAAGFPYADVAEMGPSCLVVTDGDLDLAQKEAARFADRMFEMRGGLGTHLPDAAEAVKKALETPEGPVVLVEMGDNVGGGSAADSTFILGEILRQGADRTVSVIYDPEAVEACAQVGVRNQIELFIGGKTDDIHGDPVQIKGTVRCIHDGLYEEQEVRHGGKRFCDQGLSAVIETEKKNLIAVTSLREPPFSLHQIISLGIVPERQRILVVKAAIAYRAAYEPIAKRILEVDTPGTTTPNPAHLNYQNIRRPIYPLDEV